MSIFTKTTLTSLQHDTLAEIRMTLRQPLYATSILLCPPLFYALFSSFSGAEPGGAERITAASALLGAICSSLFAIGQSTSQERADGSLLLRRTTPLPTALPFFAKLLATLLLTLLATALIIPTGWLLGDVAPLGFFITLLPALVLGTVALSALGLLQGTLVRPQASATLSQFIFLILYLTSGAVLPLEALPEVLENAARLSPSFYTFELMMGAPPVATLVPLGVFSLVAYGAAFWLSARRELL